MVRSRRYAVIPRGGNNVQHLRFVEGFREQIERALAEHLHPELIIGKPRTDHDEAGGRRSRGGLQQIAPGAVRQEVLADRENDSLLLEKWKCLGKRVRR